MLNKPDLTISQVEEPFGRICSSGHVASDNFTIDNNSLPTRFFSVVGNGISGVFCEVCLTAANYISKQTKRK